MGNSGVWGFLPESGLLLTGGQGQQQTCNTQRPAQETHLWVKSNSHAVGGTWGSVLELWLWTREAMALGMGRACWQVRLRAVAPRSNALRVRRCVWQPAGVGGHGVCV